MLAALYLVQEQQGYLTANAHAPRRASSCDMTPAEVEDVATYYVMFFKEPVGKYVLQVCRTLSCALAGAERVTEALAEKLGHQVGRDRSRRGCSRCSSSSASAPATARRS